MALPKSKPTHSKYFEEHFQNLIDDVERDDENEDEDYDVAMDLSSANHVIMNDIDHDQQDDFEMGALDNGGYNTLISLLLNSQGMGSNIPIKNRVFDKKMNQKFKVSSVGMQGYRDNMEDQHLIQFTLKNHPNCSVFGVFDGHGGDLTSEFVKTKLAELLQECDNFDDESQLKKCIKQLDEKWIKFENNYFKSQQDKDREKREDDEIKAFTQDSSSDDQEEENQLKNGTNVNKDSNIGNVQQKNENNTKNIITTIDGKEPETTANEEEDEEDENCILGFNPTDVIGTNEKGTVGTTVVFSIVRYNKSEKNYTIITVNLGDSRAILLRNKANNSISVSGSLNGNKMDTNEEEDSLDNENESWKLIELSEDHKPDNKEEKERIETAGGYVQNSRVDGDLALSRAIGDTRYKQNKILPAEEQKISCVPDITYHTASGGDVLMLYCDGIVEYKNNEQVFQFVSSKLISMEEEEEETVTKKKKKKKMSINSHLTAEEILYFQEKLSLTLQHENELKPMDKLLCDLTDFALDSGSKDNMTAMIIKLCKQEEKSDSNSELQLIKERIWCPSEFHEFKKSFDQIGENNALNEEEKRLNKWMNLFEQDCRNVGFHLEDQYEQILLQKSLFINDLISSFRTENEIKDEIKFQNERLIECIKAQEEEEQQQQQKKSSSSSSNSPPKSGRKNRKKNKKNKKRRLSDVSNSQNVGSACSGSPSIKKRKL